MKRGIDENRAILYLGNEEKCFACFKDRYARMYTIYLTSTIDEGRSIMKCQPIEIVLVLYSAFVQSPEEFLHYIAEAYPATVRIMINNKPEDIATLGKEDIGCFSHIISVPYTHTELHNIIDTQLKIKTLEKENKMLKAKVRQNPFFLNEENHVNEKKSTDMIKSLMLNEQCYRDMLLCVVDWIWEVDTHGQYTFVLGKTHEVLGYEPEAMIGRDLFEFMLKEESNQIKKIFKKCSREKKPIYNLENWNKSASGSRVCLLINGIPVVDNNGMLIGYRGLSLDITSRKKGEKDINLLLDNMLNRVKEINCVNEIINSIQEEKSIDDIFKVTLIMVPLGFEYPEIACARICFYNAEFYSDAFEKSIWMLKSDIYVKGMQSGSIEVYYKEKRPESNIGPFMIEEKKMLDAIALVLGKMLELRINESSLKFNEERYALAQRFAGIGSWDWDINSGKIEWSDEVYEIMRFGSERKQVTYEMFMQCIYEEDREYVHNAVRACIDEGKEYAIEHRLSIRSPDGSLCWMSEMGDVIRDSEGNAIRMLGVVQDITSQKKAEKALRTSHDRIDTIIKSVGDGLIVTDCQHNVLLINHAAEELLHIEFDDVKNKPIEFAIEEKTLREKFKKLYNKMGSNYEFDFTIRGSAAVQPRIIHARTSIIYDKQGTQTGIVSIIHDVTHMRELDRIKNEFISTAAHELRTPLTSIQGYSEILLLRENLEESEKNKFLTYINQQAVKLTHIVNDLLDVSRIESGKGFAFNKKKTDIISIIKNTVQLFQGVSVKHRITMEVAGEPVMIRIDKDKIEQLFKNLLSNAIKYSPSGGNVNIIGEKNRETYHIIVEDHGIGMTPDQIKKIFDKFYRVDSSNSAPEGTGLGMTIVKHIVEAHAGRIWVESEYGKGTMIHVKLPLNASVQGAV